MSKSLPRRPLQPALTNHPPLRFSPHSPAGLPAGRRPKRHARPPINRRPFRCRRASHDHRALSAEADDASLGMETLPTSFCSAGYFPPCCGDTSALNFSFLDGLIRPCCELSFPRGGVEQRVYCFPRLLGVQWKSPSPHVWSAPFWQAI
jgi:hypothetical protein